MLNQFESTSIFCIARNDLNASVQDEEGQSPSVLLKLNLQPGGVLHPVFMVKNSFRPPVVPDSFKGF
jgi:hypothetical protein